jgi:DNA mismatch repair protein MutS2
MTTPAHESTAFAAELNNETPVVDLHGMRADEARHALEHAVNHQFMEGAEAIRIIHGRGDGILRRMVHDALKAQAELVAYFRDSTAPGQQGGATIAVLHKRR